jgi:hypothetical protein
VKSRRCQRRLFGGPKREISPDYVSALSRTAAACVCATCQSGRASSAGNALVQAQKRAHAALASLTGRRISYHVRRSSRAISESLSVAGTTELSLPADSITAFVSSSTKSGTPSLLATMAAMVSADRPCEAATPRLSPTRPLQRRLSVEQKIVRQGGAARRWG